MPRTDRIKLGVALVILAIVSAAAETSRSAMADGSCWNLKKTNCCTNLAPLIDADCGSWICLAGIVDTDPLVTSTSAASGWDQFVLASPSGNASACEYYPVTCDVPPVYCSCSISTMLIYCVDLTHPGVPKNCP